MSWVAERSLTLVMLGLFAICLAGQIVAGWYEFNEEQIEHGAAALALLSYLRVGHPWEALFENWESEFLQMTAFVTLTAILHQKGSPESRRPGAIEAVDADPRDFAHLDDAPWPVKARRLGLARLRTFTWTRLVWSLCDLVDWACLGGAANRHTQQLQTRPRVHDRVWDYSVRPAVLVRVISELAERISVGGRHGLAGGLSTSAWLSRIKAGSCGALGDRAVRRSGKVSNRRHETRHRTRTDGR